LLRPLPLQALQVPAAQQQALMHQALLLLPTCRSSVLRVAVHCWKQQHTEQLLPLSLMPLLLVLLQPLHGVVQVLQLLEAPPAVLQPVVE